MRGPQRQHHFGSFAEPRTVHTENDEGPVRAGLPAFFVYIFPFVIFYLLTRYHNSFMKFVFALGLRFLPLLFLGPRRGANHEVLARCLLARVRGAQCFTVRNARGRHLVRLRARNQAYYAQVVR